MIRRLCFCFALALGSLAWAASPPEIVPGLPYFRITDLTKDASELSNALNKDSAVLDLRGATGTPEVIAAFNQHLEKPHSGQGIRLILINPGSSVGIVDAVSRPRSRQLTLGPRTPALAPDISVSASVEEDRRAYDALASGTPIEKLISSNSEKKRFDEAALARTRANAASAADREEADSDTAESGETESVPPTVEKKAPPPPAVPHDLVLERAAQVFRALAASKRG